IPIRVLTGVPSYLSRKASPSQGHAKESTPEDTALTNSTDKLYLQNEIPLNILKGWAAAQGHCQIQLGAQNLKDVCSPLFTADGQTPERRSAYQNSPGSESDRLHDVGSPANAPVDEQI